MALKSRPLNACGPAAWGVMHTGQRMTENEIEFYISLEKKVKYKPYLFLGLLIVSVSNGFFGFIKSINVEASFIIALFFLLLLGESLFRDTADGKCLSIISKFVNSDPELIKKINARKNA